MEDMLHVEMDRFAGGIALAGDSVGGQLVFHISKISPAAAEALDGCLRVGDRVLAVNGTSTERCMATSTSFWGPSPPVSHTAPYHIPHTTYHIPHTTYHIPHTTYHIATT